MPVLSLSAARSGLTSASSSSLAPGEDEDEAERRRLSVVLPRVSTMVDWDWPVSVRGRVGQRPVLLPVRQPSVRYHTSMHIMCPIRIRYPTIQHRSELLSTSANPAYLRS